MNYTFEQLKSQIISLDFTKFNEISNLNLDELKLYIESRLVNTKQEIDTEINSFNVPEIKNLEQLSQNLKYAIRSKKLPILIPTLHLLDRIKTDIEKLT